jgi:hypothetical protein
VTTQEKLTFAGIAVGLLALIVREAHAAANERKRTQPIVIAHEHQRPHFVGTGWGWQAQAYLTNDGSGAAFNVRFGIELRGVRFAYRIEEGDDPRGNRESVVRANSRLPTGSTSTLAIPISALQFWSAAALKQDGKLHQSRAYWCRYKNAVGRTWETRNPWDRSADMQIRRVRFVRLREWLEQRKRERTEAVWDRLETAHEAELAKASSEDAR